MADRLGLRLEIIAAGVEAVDADALLLPVDGRLCVLGGAATRAMRMALDPDEVQSEFEFVTHQLKALCPLADGQARLIDGVARWGKLVVSAAYPHNVNDRLFSMDECAGMLRVAVPKAITAIHAAGLRSLAMTVIGTSYRLTPDLATCAITEGIASARNLNVLVRWAIPDEPTRALALAHCRRVGLMP